jgi:hypothetical protein
MSYVVPMIFRSWTYMKVMWNPPSVFLMNTQGQSSFFWNPFSTKNSLSLLYHILPDCFMPYNDLCSLTLYILQSSSFGTLIHLCTFIWIFASNDPYKYTVTTSINFICNSMFTTMDIKYRNVVPFITRE